MKDGSWRASCVGGRPSFRATTRTEALRRRDEFLRKHRKVLALPKRARGSFADYLRRWLDGARPRLRPRTIESYEHTITRYIDPAIGAVPIGHLSETDISKAMATADSVRTRNYIRSVCFMALEAGLNSGELHANVARRVRPLKHVSVERDMPGDELWNALMVEIDKERPATRAMLLVLAYGGLREGEVCGLRWPDYVAGDLVVMRAADRSGNLVPLKTKAGRRRVPLPDVVAEALDAWRDEQAKMRKRHGGRWSKTSTPDLMFTSRYGTPLHPRNVLRAAHRVTGRAGMGRHSAHYLRHLAISNLIADPNVDIKTVQMIAGHSSIRVTIDTYGHLMPGRLQQARESMNRRAETP